MPDDNTLPPPPPQPALSDEDARVLARRKLLKAGLVAPAVLASLVVATDAAAQCRSCNPPANCMPERCHPRATCG